MVAVNHFRSKAAVILTSYRLPLGIQRNVDVARLFIHSNHPRHGGVQIMTHWKPQLKPGCRYVSDKKQDEDKKKAEDEEKSQSGEENDSQNKKEKQSDDKKNEKSKKGNKDDNKSEEKDSKVKKTVKKTSALTWKTIQTFSPDIFTPIGMTIIEWIYQKKIRWKSLLLLLVGLGVSYCFKDIF